jgi:hypothetical protein
VIDAIRSELVVVEWGSDVDSSRVLLKPQKEE